MFLTADYIHCNKTGYTDHTYMSTLVRNPYKIIKKDAVSRSIGSFIMRTFKICTFLPNIIRLIKSRQQRLVVMQHTWQNEKCIHNVQNVLERL
jgi:hypothetical protein